MHRLCISNWHIAASAGTLAVSRSECWGCCATLRQHSWFEVCYCRCAFTVVAESRRAPTLLRSIRPALGVWHLSPLILSLVETATTSPRSGVRQTPVELSSPSAAISSRRDFAGLRTPVLIPAEHTSIATHGLDCKQDHLQFITLVYDGWKGNWTDINNKYYPCQHIV